MFLHFMGFVLYSSGAAKDMDYTEALRAVRHVKIVLVIVIVVLLILISTTIFLAVYFSQSSGMNFEI